MMKFTFQSTARWQINSYYANGGKMDSVPPLPVSIDGTLADQFLQ